MDEKPLIVYVAHPIHGDVEANIQAVSCICRDIHSDKIIPFVPYLESLHYLDDDVLLERNLGIAKDIEFFKREVIDELWIYGDKISKGMENEIKLAREYEIPIRCKSHLLEDALDEFIEKLNPQ